jgi:hypothetical protein
MIRNLFQRSYLLNVSGEKGDDGAGAYDSDGEPDDAPERPAEAVFLPHGDQREDDENQGQEYN